MALDFMSPRLAYRTCGCVGFVLALVLDLALAARLGLSLPVMAGIAVVAVLTFLALAMATKVAIGEERIVYYHHQIAVLAVSALFLWIINQPVLAFLDLTILGVGLFLAFGRIGCLKVGCCHGRPAHWGVSYRKEHVAAGFAGGLAGVPLFPVQAMESLWVASIVAVGSILVGRGSAPGEALAWYVIMYGAGRFCLEFMRGDRDRPHFLGFSEAQWTSLILMAAVLWTEARGTLIFHAWHAAIFTCMALAMIMIAAARQTAKGGHLLLAHRHVREVAQTIDTLADLTAGSGRVPVGRTSLGIQISAGTIPSAKGNLRFYTLSRQNGAMTESAATTLAGLIRRLRHPRERLEVIKGTRGTFHVLVREEVT